VKRVLIVDDAATVRMFHRGILETAGYSVAEAVNGIEGLEKALAESFDVILVDINMPKLDGYGFLRELRAQPSVQPPTIMISTESSDADRTRGYEAGANAYLRKPARPAQLLAYVHVLVGAVTS
jgi:two-component system chemotaxis response regulator CheY